MAKKKFKLNKPVLKALARLYFTFGVILLFFVIAFSTNAVHEAVVVPFTSLVAAASGVMMNLFGAGASVFGNHLSTAGYSINVVDGCNGIYATAILISGVIAYPSRLIQKAWGIALGFLAVFILNLGRVISLFYLGQYYPDIFNEVHVYVWQPIIILWAIFVWDFWSRQIEGRKKGHAAAR
jgi:exosortase H (IPTLxxWG-CTERM-specific)